jgi:hypothetical protein
MTNNNLTNRQIEDFYKTIAMNEFTTGTYDSMKDLMAVADLMEYGKRDDVKVLTNEVHKLMSIEHTLNELIDEKMDLDVTLVSALQAIQAARDVAFAKIEQCEEAISKAVAVYRGAELYLRDGWTE